MTEELRRTESKPTKAELRRRIDITESLLIDCATVTDTVRYFTDREGLVIARRTIERYRQLAEKRIVKAAEPIRHVEIGKAKLRLERCFARAMSGGKKNISAAIAALKVLNNLLGLHPQKDGEELFDIEKMAKLMVLEQKEMDRVMGGPLYLREEIAALVDRYKGTSPSSEELLREITELLHLSKRDD